MNTFNKYKITVFVLLAIAITQGLFIFHQHLKSLRTKAAVPLPAVSAKGKIAIVIDDWGYSLNNLAAAKGIKYPFTASVLPGLKYSKVVAEGLHADGKEIILHLPMQPNEETRLEKNTIRVSMGEQEIKSILSEDLSGIPYAKGVSNHMGSRVTPDSRVIAILFSELKIRRLFFLDSLTSFKSVCAVEAKDINLPFARRDIFIDNELERGYIKRQIYKLAAKAKSKGSAVGIGHDRKVTFEVLREVMPEIEKEGYKFVYLSELVK